MMNNKTENIVYIVINASNNSMATKAFREYKDAERHYKALIEVACNPNSYYIQMVEIV